MRNLIKYYQSNILNFIEDYFDITISCYQKIMLKAFEKGYNILFFMPQHIFA